MNSAGPPLPGTIGTQQWFHVWRAAVMSPRTSTYADIASRPGVNSRRALAWMLTASLTSVLPLVSLSLLHIRSGVSTTRVADALAEALNSPLLLTFVPIAIGVVTALGLAAWAAIAHLTARLLGGDGRFPALLFGFAAFSAPLTLIGTVLVTVTPVQGLSTIAFAYQVLLAIIATKAIHRLGWVRAIVPTALATVLVFVVAPFCLQAILFLILFRPAP